MNDPKLNLIPQASLKDYTTFRLGGACKGLIHCQTPEQLQYAVQQLHKQGLPFILIGGGSNLVVSDKGLDCYVIRYVSDTPLIKNEGGVVFVSGATDLDALALYTAQSGLEGLIYTSGIPGTVGGAIVGNAGAFGKQVGDCLESVVLMRRDGTTFEAKPEDLGFSYRHSDLKARDEIVVSAKFKVTPADAKKLMDERNEILAIRHEKHPDLKEFPCAGSFFRNVEPTSKAGRRQAAGWFLDQAGGKSLSHGGARIFDKHANIIVKSQGCTAQDVFELQKKMHDLVKRFYNIDLVREVRFVGDFAGKPAGLNDVVW